VVAHAVPAERLDLSHLGDLSLYSRNSVIAPLALVTSGGWAPLAYRIEIGGAIEESQKGQIAHIEYVHEEPILWRLNRDMAITVRCDGSGRSEAMAASPCSFAVAIDKDQVSVVGVRINISFLARLGAFRLGPSKRKYLSMNRPSRERSGWPQTRQFISTSVEGPAST